MKQKYGLLLFLAIALNANAQNVGVGISTPLTKLHIYNGASGATPFAFSPLAVESNGHTYINLLSPAVNETAILFGQPGSSANGVLMYNNSSTPNGFQIRNNGNLTRMIIDNTGNVSIGSLAPYSPLTFNSTFGEKISMYGSAAANFGFGVQSGLFQIHSDNIAGDIGIGTGSSSSFNEVVRIKGSGYVGIGNTAPTAKLHIESSDGSGFPQLRINQANAGDYVRARLTNANTNTNNRYWDVAAFIDATLNSSDRLNFYNSTGLDVLSLAGDGRVGVGTLNPQVKLHVYNGSSGQPSPFSPFVVEGSTNTYINILSPNLNETGILFGKANNAASGGIVYNSSGVPSTPNGFQFRVNGNQTVANLTSAGNMGIGMGALSSGRLTLAQTPSTDFPLWLYLINASGNGEYHWQMGIGANPNYRLYFTALNGAVSFIDATSCNYVSISDKKYKKDIHSIRSVLPKLMELNPVSYKMKEQLTDELTYGFLAQELQKVFPDAVKTFDKSGALGISYTHLIPLTVSAIQEQQKIIENQQAQIDELKKLVDQLVKNK